MLLSGLNYDTDGNANTTGTTASRLSPSDSTPYGEWLKLELPNKIKLDKYVFTSRNHATHWAQGPENGQVWGSNDDSNWTHLHTFTGSGFTGLSQSASFNVQTDSYYKYYAFIVTKTFAAGSDYYLCVPELKYYGHEEGSGSLDTTLKTVYNVPATTGTQLEVYYDGQDYSDMPTVGSASVTDKAGGDQTGTPGTGVSFDSTYKAFVFDGSTNGKITGTHGLGTGIGITPTISLWFKLNSTGNQRLVIIGDQNTQYKSINVTHFNGRIAVDYWLSEVQTPLNSVIADQWYHLAIVHKGPGTTATGSQDIYLNNVKQTLNLHASNNSNSTFDLQGTGFTIGADPAGTNPLTGSIANFRLYSKALNADQMKELYDYQKDYFLGSKSQVTLYKGHLGVGVTEPSGQLELAGDERIQEYPPRDLYQYDTNIEGHGVFCASASIEYTDGNHPPWEAFSDSATSASSESVWTTNGALYDTTSGLHTGSTTTAGIKGEWIQLKTPYKIKISSFNLNSYAVSVNSNRQPRDFILLGSNDGNVWEQMKSVAGQTKSGYTAVAPVYSGPLGPHHTVNSTKYYSYFRIVVTANQGGDALLGISRIRFFGTPGPTTLDKGSLTLGRSLDVPRVSRYDVDTETPRPEKLVLDLDTTVNSSPTDISGKGNHGVYYNGASYSPADKAFEFDNTQGGIRAQTTNFDTSGKHSFVAWMKFESFGQWYGLYGIGTNDGSASNFTIYTGTGGSGDVGNTGFRLESRGGGRHQDLAWTPVLNTWVHVAVTWDGTGGLNNVNMYIDLVKLERQQLGNYENNPTSSITLPSTQAIRVGADARQFDGAGTGSNFDGQISNPKLYNVALEPSEVKKLYRLGRTGRSMVISDTAVGIGKAPEAQLDVRGTFRAPGTIVQVKQAVKKDTQSTTAGSPVDVSGLSVTIQPKFSNSKILVSYQVNMGGNYHMFLRVFRTQNGATAIVGSGNTAGNRPEASSHQSHVDLRDMKSMNMEILEPCNGTDAIEYKVQFWVAAATHYTAFINRAMTADNNVYNAYVSSSITVKEVCQ
jgi:hypothetical protein